MASTSKTLTTVFAAKDNLTKTLNSIADSGEKATSKVSELQKILKNNFYSKEAENCAEKMEKAFEKAEKGSVASVRDIESAIEKGFREATQDITTTAARIQKLENELADSKNRVTELEAAIEKLGNSSDDTDKKINGMGDSLKGVTGLLKGAAAAAGTYIGISTINESINGELKALNQFRARVGSAGDMSKYKLSMDSIYRNGMGESVEDVADSMATVKINTGLDGSELESTTNNALLLRDVFDFDVSESTRAVAMMMKQFDVSGDTAYSLIAQGAQNGLNKNGDLLDTINEYSVHFEQLGFGAEDMFNMLVNGTESGTFSVDKLGDSIKEFGIRVIDGSDTTKTGFESIGLSADLMARKFSKGGESAKEAFTETIEALKNVEDPIVQNTAGVNLFGTMWEDLGSKGVIALSDINGKISETSIALEEINSVKYQDLDSTFETVSRSLMGELTDGLMGNTDNIISEFRDMETKLQPVFKGIGEGIGGVLEDVPDMLESVGSGIEYVTEHAELLETAFMGIGSAIVTYKVATGISSVTTAVKGLGTVIAANPVLTIITGVTGGLIALETAYTNFKENAKKTNLEKHFGDISLSMDECNGIAKEILDNGNFEKLAESTKAFAEVDNNVSSLNDTLSSINKDNWKINLGFEVEKEEYISNIDSYIEDSLELLQNKEYAVTLAINTAFGEGETADEWTSSASGLYSQLYEDLNSYGQKLRDAVLEGYEKGWTPDTQEAVTGILNSMNEIDQKIATAESEARLESIKLDFVNSDLSSESYSVLQESLQTELDSMQKQYEDLRIQMIAEAKLEYSYNGNESELNQKIEEAQTMYDTNMANLDATSINFQADVITSAYNDEIATALSEMQGTTHRGLDSMLRDFENGKWTSIDSNWLYGMLYGGTLEDETKDVILEFTESIKPTQEELQKIIENMKIVPETAVEALNNFDALRAISGDKDSILKYIGQVYALSESNPKYGEMIEFIKKDTSNLNDTVAESMTTTEELTKYENASDKIASTALDTLKSSLEEGITATIPVTATASVNIDVKESTGEKIENNALGGIYDSPLLTWVAEAGTAEAIIPLNSSQRARDLWYEAGEAIGAASGENLYTERAPMYKTDNETVTNSIIHNTTQKEIVLKLEGNAEIKIPKGITKEEVIEILKEYLEPVLLEKIYIELFEGGDESFDT